MVWSAQNEICRLRFRELVTTPHRRNLMARRGETSRFGVLRRRS
jgi:hypothetical protein